MSADDPAYVRAKRSIRHLVKARRDQIAGEERQVATVHITNAVTAILDVAFAERTSQPPVLALYAPKGSEVGTLPLDTHARAAGWRVVYPRVVPGTRQLAFHEVQAAQLGAGHFGLSEPSSDAPEVALAEIAAFIVPGLVFDPRGARIGWGHGYYDTTLAAAPRSALRIGIAFHCQMLDTIARDSHDVPMHHVVTDRAMFQADPQAVTVE